MQIKKLIPSLMEQWKAIYETERPHLKPNAITGEALTRYIEDRFAVQPSEDESLQNAVRGMLAQSALVRQKVGDGEVRPVAYRIDDGTVIGVDLLTGIFIVQDNMAVRDELTYVRGLDESDLENVLLTVDWLRCRNLWEQKEKPKRSGKKKK